MCSVCVQSCSSFFQRGERHGQDIMVACLVTAKFVLLVAAASKSQGKLSSSVQVATSSA